MTPTEPSPIGNLPDIEEESQSLAERLRKIREAIDTLEHATSLKPGAAALLTRYRSSASKVSWELQQLDRKIDRLRTADAAAARSADFPALEPTYGIDLTAADPDDEMLEHAGEVRRDVGWW